MGIRNNRGEGGAALVEMAFVLPLLLLMLLGIIEMGYILGQFNEVRHGVHEGARLAAVDDANLLTNTCNSMQLTSNVTVSFVDGSTGSKGEQGSVTVTATVNSLSGLGWIEVFLPSNLSDTASFRLEQDSDNWDNTSGGTC